MINVDFQGASGETSTASAGAVLQPVGSLWNVNGQGFGAEVPLATSFGGVSGVSLWTDGLMMESWLGDALFHDYMSGDFELRGLEANQSYELVLYTPANIQTEYYFHGTWTPTAASASPPFRDIGDPSLPGIEGSDYIRGMVVADGSGVIAVNAALGGVAGLQLDVPALANPEPTVVMLQALAAVIGLTRRRRN